MFKKFRFLFHPILVLILAQISWVWLMFIWIRWYLKRNIEINRFINELPVSASSGQWIILAQGCVLMGFILVGLYIIFVSQRRSQRLAKMQDTILSSVTHELKTPLASIKLYTETLVLRNVTEDEKILFLKRTLFETERLQKLIDTILISARLEAYGYPSDHVCLDLMEIFLSSFYKAKDRFSKNRSFKLNTFNNKYKKRFYILGNNAHLSVLFDNLFDNAVKYTEKNGLIQVSFLQKKGSYVIQIKDNGLGIEKRNLRKIFKKFYRVQQDPVLRVSGSGLGLSVCHSIVKEHNGKIFAHSDGLGKGSIFYVELQKFYSDY